MNYIHNNYFEDISLNDLSDHIGHSLKYTSLLFKKLCGENFKYVLNSYRVEKAKEIMKESSDIKVQELSELVGCNSANTFIRMFKQYEGVSPGKYLKR